MSQPIAGAECYFSMNMDGIPDRLYTYKIPPNIQVKPGDLVVVPRNADGFGLVTVHRVNNNMVWRSGIPWKWLIQKVDLTDYKARLMLEKNTSK